MALPAGEPVAGPWRAMTIDELVELVEQIRGPGARPCFVAVDGRGASGKSTLAERIRRRTAASVVVHTDDIAWNHSFFGWASLLRDGVLRPAREGAAVSFRPPTWAAHGRAGSIDVPAGQSMVIVEGVGASRRELADQLDVAIWVQSDFAAAEERGIERDVADGTNGNRDEAVAFWHRWMDQELRFFRDDRPWERADLIIAGTRSISLRPDQVAVAVPR